MQRIKVIFGAGISQGYSQTKLSGQAYVSSYYDVFPGE